MVFPLRPPHVDVCRPQATLGHFLGFDGETRSFVSCSRDSIRREHKGASGRPGLRAYVPSAAAMSPIRFRPRPVSAQRATSARSPPPCNLLARLLRGSLQEKWSCQRRRCLQERPPGRGWKGCARLPRAGFCLGEGVLARCPFASQSSQSVCVCLVRRAWLLSCLARKIGRASCRERVWVLG